MKRLLRIAVISIGSILPIWLAWGQISALVSFNSTTAANPCGSPVSGSQFWFSADCITLSGGVCSTPSNGSSVTTWSDRSGNSRNATTFTGTLTFNTSQINGLPAVSSTGSSYANIGGSTISASNAHTVFAAAATTNNPGVGGIVGGTSGAGSLLYYMATPSGQATDCPGFFYGGTSGAFTSGTFYQINLEQHGPAFSGTFLQFRRNRATDSTTAPGTACNANPPTQIFTYSDASNTFKGKIAEIIYYNSNLGGTDTTTNETYLNCRYGL
jgi:hypothetical protein